MLRDERVIAKRKLLLLLLLLLNRGGRCGCVVYLWLVLMVGVMVGMVARSVYAHHVHGTPCHSHSSQASCSCSCYRHLALL